MVPGTSNLYVVERRSNPNCTTNALDQVRDNTGRWWQLTYALPARGTADTHGQVLADGTIRIIY